MGANREPTPEKLSSDHLRFGRLWQGAVQSNDPQGKVLCPVSQVTWR
jgi:hypothetical protein